MCVVYVCLCFYMLRGSYDPSIGIRTFSSVRRSPHRRTQPNGQQKKKERVGKTGMNREKDAPQSVNIGKESATYGTFCAHFLYHLLPQWSCVAGGFCGRNDFIVAPVFFSIRHRHFYNVAVVVIVGRPRFRSFLLCFLLAFYFIVSIARGEAKTDRS